LKKKVSGEISPARRWLASVFGIFEITSVNQKIAVLAQSIVEETAILVSKSSVFLRREKGRTFRIAFNKILECLKTPTSDLFILVGFIIGTIPLADEFNGQRFLVIHFQHVTPDNGPDLQPQVCSVTFLAVSTSSYIYKGPSSTFVPCESSSRFPPFLKRTVTPILVAEHVHATTQDLGS
jgi:hypothetical protein